MTRTLHESSLRDLERRGLATEARRRAHDMILDGAPWSLVLTEESIEDLVVIDDRLPLIKEEDLLTGGASYADRGRH